MKTEPLSVQMREWDRLNRPSDAASYADEVAALEAENDRLRSSVMNSQGDDLCWFDTSASRPDTAIPPAAEFLESCRRFHEQIAGESGVLEGCMTIAQLEAEVERLRAALDRVRRGYLNILEMRKLSTGRYGALTREEIEGVLSEVDAVLERTADTASPLGNEAAN